MDREMDKEEFQEASVMVFRLLANMTPDQRLEIFGNYCLSCGDPDPDCQCWNDE